MLTLEQRNRHHLKEGILIAIEGIDGAGKTTQAERLRSTLTEQGYDAVVFHEPTTGEWGRKIAALGMNGRGLKVDEEFKYFYEDRKEDVARNINPALQKKQLVIMDRYYFSNMAYQGERGLDSAEIEKANLDFSPKPTLIILLEIPAKEAMQRIKRYRNGPKNHFEERLSRVGKMFRRISKNRQDVKKVDATKPLESVHSTILSLLRPILKELE